MPSCPHCKAEFKARNPILQVLTPNQYRLISLIAQGKTRTEIAAITGKTQHNVSQTLSMATAKLGTDNDVDLMLMVWELSNET